MTSQYPAGGGGPTATLNIPDYTSQQGAANLAAKITAYWARKGKPVAVWTEEAYNAADGQRSFVVRSTMVGGQP